MRPRIALHLGAILLLGVAACGSTPSPVATSAAAKSPATIKLPIERNGRYVLEFDNIRFEVVPAGGKVVSFRIDGHEMLVATHPLNFGSTVWASPQSNWNWPPQTAIDSEPYTVSVTGNTITMTSGITRGVPKIRLTKQFTPNLAKRAIDIEYTLVNEDNSPRNLAIWEVTRVAPGGLSFFPIVGSTSGKDGSTLVPTLVKEGYAWIDMATNPTGNNKLHGDGGASFIAHTDGQRLLVKSWSDVAANAQAPEHGEVEFYDGDTYVELENQGPYGPVPAGGSTTWKVRWSLVNLPAGAAKIVQDKNLVNAARALAAVP
jgi:hypothetical protein